MPKSKSYNLVKITAIVYLIFIIGVDSLCGSSHCGISICTYDQIKPVASKQQGLAPNCTQCSVSSCQSAEEELLCQSYLGFFKIVLFELSLNCQRYSDPYFFSLDISFSQAKVRLHTKNQLHREKVYYVKSTTIHIYT